MQVKGFTVIELLVTVAIISILAGLLLSAVSTAKLKAQRVACRTVLRSYASEFSEWQNKLVIRIPQEANCHQCHYPRYDAGPFLDTVDSERP